MNSYFPTITYSNTCRLLACKPHCNLEVVMKRTFRLLALSAVVLTALGFTAVGAMALTPVTRIGVVTTSATPESKDEVVGTVTVTDILGTQTVTTQDLTGTAEPSSKEDSISTVEPVETETASPDIHHSSGEQNGSNQDMTTNNLNRDSGNRSGQNMGNNQSGQDSQNSSNHDSGNGSNNSSGSGGN